MVYVHLVQTVNLELEAHSWFGHSPVDFRLAESPNRKAWNHLSKPTCSSCLPLLPLCVALITPYTGGSAALCTPHNQANVPMARTVFLVTFTWCYCVLRAVCQPLVFYPAVCMSGLAGGRCVTAADPCAPVWCRRRRRSENLHLCLRESRLVSWVLHLTLSQFIGIMRTSYKMPTNSP